MLLHSERIVGPNGRGFSTFSPQGIGNTVWSFARQAQISNEVVQSFGLDNVNIGTTGRLAMYETSCLDVGEDLIKTLFVKAAQAAMKMGLDKFRSQGETEQLALLFNLFRLFSSHFACLLFKRLVKFLLGILDHGFVTH